MADKELKEMKSSAWGWSIVGVLATIFAIASEDIPLLVGILPITFATSLWCIILRQEEQDDAENSDLFDNNDI